MWLQTGEQRALRQLEASDRGALYERTLQSLRRPCSEADRPAPLDDFCLRQADFILEFPECDAECRELSKKVHPMPAR
jgi:hypothetical protein